MWALIILILVVPATPIYTFLVMPNTGKLQLKQEVNTNPKMGSTWLFLIINQVAEPTYHKVKLEDYEILIGLTVTGAYAWKQSWS